METQAPRDVRPGGEVVSLPMRDGNMGEMVPLRKVLEVVSLPMRDGNIHDFTFVLLYTDCC